MDKTAFEHQYVATLAVARDALIKQALSPAAIEGMVGRGVKSRLMKLLAGTHMPVHGDGGVATVALQTPGVRRTVLNNRVTKYIDGKNVDQKLPLRALYKHNLSKINQVTKLKPLPPAPASWT